MVNEYRRWQNVRQNALGRSVVDGSTAGLHIQGMVDPDDDEISYAALSQGWAHRTCAREEQQPSIASSKGIEARQIVLALTLQREQRPSQEPLI